jgi:cell division protein FtsW
VRQSQGERWYDYSLLFIVILLSAFGMVMIFSSSYAMSKNGGTHFFLRQLLWSVAGTALMVVISLVDYHVWMRLAMPGYVLSILLMFLIYITPLGREVNGKVRWLRVGNHNLFQPSELVKAAVIVFMAYYCAKHIRDLDERMTTLAALGLAFLPGIVVAYSNLSTGAIIAGIAFSICFVASREKFRYAAIVLAVIGFVVMIVLLVKLTPVGDLDIYYIKRIKVWPDFEAYSQGGGFQTLQGLYAIGSGGLTGKGLGNSLQKLGNIPEAHNDMIFAIVCEELGLFGGICLILVLTYLIYRLLVIAMNAPDIKGLLLMTGIIVHVSLQTIFHIAVVLGVMPNTGVSLPFVSYGGTTTLMLMAEMGLALSVSRSVVLK